MNHIAPYGISDAYMILYEKSEHVDIYPAAEDTGQYLVVHLAHLEQPAGYSSAFNGVNAPSNVT